MTNAAMPPAIRAMTARDAAAVARLHAQSWRAAYRGILDDGYLAGAVDADLRRLWRARLGRIAARHVGLVATLPDGKLAGFAYAIVDDDPEHGTLLANLHVAPALHRHGIGCALLRALVDAIPRAGSRRPIHLWAYEANRRTRAFYERLGAKPLERALTTTSGGRSAAAWCYAWTNPAALRRALASKPKRDGGDLRDRIDRA